MTFSAGLAFAKSGVPVRSLAAAGDSALEAAKDGGRNRVGFGSFVMTWGDFGWAISLHKNLLAASQDAGDGLNPSLLYRLLRYADMAAEASSNQPTLASLKWRSQLNYDLKRNLSQKAPGSGAWCGMRSNPKPDPDLPPFPVPGAMRVG